MYRNTHIGKLYEIHISKGLYLRIDFNYPWHCLLFTTSELSMPNRNTKTIFSHHQIEGEVSTLVSILVYFNFYENDPSSVWLSSEAPLLPQTLLVLNYESLKLHGVHGRNTPRWNMHITFIVDCIKLGNLKE